MYRHILFDFDGTLVDSKYVLLEVFNGLADKYKFNKLDEESFRIVNNMSIKKRLKMLGIPYYRTFRLKRLQKESGLEYRKHLLSIQLFEGIEELLLKLNESGYTLAVVTSNSAENIIQYFGMKKLNVFQTICDSKGFFGKSRRIKRYIKENKISKRDVLYVGDELRDIEACHDIGIDVAAVTWGLDNKEILESAKPTYMVDECGKLLEILKR